MAFALAMILDRALRDAGIPIDGVSIGAPADRATWRAIYAPAATPAQIAQGNALILSIDPQDATTISNLKQDLAASATNMDLILSLGQATYELAQAPASFPTLLSFRQRVMTLLRNRL